MKGLWKYINSSIGKKQVMAVAGIVMILFLLGHMSGNFLLFKGPEKFNAYADFLQSLGAPLWIMRLGMLGAFAVHVYSTLRLYIENRQARPVRYHVAPSSPERSFSTKTMLISALIIFSFIITHLFNFTLSTKVGIPTMINGQELGLYGLVVNTFLNPLWSAFYILVMITVGFHLNHAIQSVFQTVGFHHSAYTPVLKKLGTLVSVVVAIGFSSIPIYLFITISKGG